MTGTPSRRRSANHLLALALLAGCTASRGVPAPPAVARVAVLPPGNRTADPLVVTGTSLLERYALDVERTTVVDVLRIELRARLGERGVAVVAADTVRAAMGGRTAGTAAAAAEIAHRGRLDDPALFVAIDRWELDNPTHPAFVIVALDATLIEPATGAVLWHWHRGARPIATPGAVTAATAHEIAARAVAAEIASSWPPAPAG